MVVIKCPEPRNAPEALYIGIILNQTPRYFLSEYETNAEMKVLYPEQEWSEKYILCECEGKTYKNYGEVENTKEAFVEAVLRLLTN